MSLSSPGLVAAAAAATTASTDSALSGVPAVDASLQRLADDVSSALSRLRRAAAEARRTAEARRDELAAALAVAFSQVLADINAAEASKTEALSAQLAEVLDAPGHLDAAVRAAREAADSLDDVSLVGRHGSLLARLRRDHARLLDVSRLAPAADATLVLTPSSGAAAEALLASDPLGALVTAAVAPADLRVVGLAGAVPPSRGGVRRVLPGAVLAFQLVLSESARRRLGGGGRAAAALAAVARGAPLLCSLLPPEGAWEQDCGSGDAEGRRLRGPAAPLAAAVAVNEASSCLDVSLAVPASAAPGAFLRIDAAGVLLPLMCHSSSGGVAGLPLELTVAAPMDKEGVGAAAGLRAPLSLAGAAYGLYQTPCVSPAGEVFVPHGDAVLVYDRHGVACAALECAAASMEPTALVAAFDDASGTLLVAETEDRRNRLVGFDAATLTRRWATSPGALSWVFGCAVIGRSGVAVVGAHNGHTLHAHRASDGARVASVSLSGPTFVAADPTAPTHARPLVFASTGLAGESRVAVFAWDGARLVAQGEAEAAGGAPAARPVAVVPLRSPRSSGGGGGGHLVVGCHLSPELLVLSLPELRLVHRHVIAGAAVCGLAGDPLGGALVVCDAASGAALVLPWPLPGMPGAQGPGASSVQ